MAKEDATANLLQEVRALGEDFIKELSELKPSELSAEEREQVLAALERLTPAIDAASRRLKGNVG